MEWINGTAHRDTYCVKSRDTQYLSSMVWIGVRGTRTKQFTNVHITHYYLFFLFFWMCVYKVRRFEIYRVYKTSWMSYVCTWWWESSVEFGLCVAKWSLAFLCQTKRLSCKVYAVRYYLNDIKCIETRCKQLLPWWLTRFVFFFFYFLCC